MGSGSWACSPIVWAPTGIVWVLSSVREQPALVRALAPLPARDPRATGLFAAVFAFSFVLTLVVASLAAAAVYVLFTGPLNYDEHRLRSRTCEPRRLPARHQHLLEHGHRLRRLPSGPGAVLGAPAPSTRVSRPRMSFAASSSATSGARSLPPSRRGRPRSFHRVAHPPPLDPFPGRPFSAARRATTGVAGETFGRGLKITPSTLADGIRERVEALWSTRCDRGVSCPWTRTIGRGHSAAVTSS